MNNRQPLFVIGLLAAIGLASLVFGALMPGIVAWHGKVFFQSGIDSKLKSLPNASQLMQDFAKRQSILTERLAQIDATTSDAIKSGKTIDFSALRSERTTVQMQLKDERPPVSAQPFYQHVIMYFWPLMYFCLGTLILVLRPPSSKSTKAFDLRQTLQIGIMAAIVFVFATGPLIGRNLIARYLSEFRNLSEFRIVYAYSNLDVDPPSFICQIVNFLIFSALISILWNQWMRYSVMIRSQVTARDFGSGVEGALDPDTLDQLSTELIRWQTCLAVLSIGFIGYTAIFWKQVIQNGDSRYVGEGFIAHVFWVISAVLMAMPFWVMWRAWRLSRIRALGELIQMPASESASLEARISAFRELRPVGAWNLAAFVATVASALAAPAIQLIFKLAHLA